MHTNRHTIQALAHTHTHALPDFSQPPTSTHTSAAFPSPRTVFEQLMILPLIAQHPLRSLQAALLNLSPHMTRLVFLFFFFYYMTAGIFHFHTEIVSKKVISILVSTHPPSPLSLLLSLCLSPKLFLHPSSLSSSFS